MARVRLAVKAWVAMGLAVLVAGSTTVAVPARAQDPEPCEPQPMPYNVTVSVTPATVEVGQDVELEARATDATGAPIECGVVTVRLSGGGTVPSRVSPRVQQGGGEVAIARLRGFEEIPPMRVEEPGNFSLRTCVELGDGSQTCSGQTSLTATCDVYGTDGADTMNRFTPQLPNGISVCLLGGDDTFTLQDDLDSDQQRSIFVSGGSGDDFMSFQYVTGNGTDARPFPYLFVGGGGDDQTGRGLIDLHGFDGYVPPVQVGDWTYPAIRPPVAQPGNDVLRLPLLGGTAIAGPGNDRVEGGAEGPNTIHGQLDMALLEALMFGGLEEYLALVVEDADSLLGGGRADVVEGGFDDDVIDLFGGTDRAVGDLFFFQGVPLSELFPELRLGDDVINAGSNPPGAPVESILGEITPVLVIARVPAPMQSGLPPGEGGDDTLVGGSGRQRLVGQGGNDRLTGGAGGDNLNGGAGNDVLKGSAGADVLTAGAGRDVLDGGKGNDECAGGAGPDRESSC